MSLGMAAFAILASYIVGLGYGYAWGKWTGRQVR
jgi:hypothetical protein